MADKTAAVKLDLPLESSTARLVILEMPNGVTVAGRVEVVNDRTIYVSDLVRKWKR